MSKVSIILTSFNHDKYIQKAIESVLNQTYTDFELIIWDDASHDNSWLVISKYSDPRIRAYRNEVNRGPVMGINKAIFEMALGEYIAIHHSDDIWEPNKLQKQVDFLDANQGIGAVFTNAQPIDERGAPLANTAHFYYCIFSQPNRSRYEWLRFFFLSGNALCHPSVLIRKQCYVECGPYVDLFAQVPDWDMWVRLCTKHEIYVLPERLVQFRIHDGELNASGDRPITRIRWPYEYFKVLQRFQVIAGKETIFKIFPDFISYDRRENTDAEYVLARVCLESGSFFLRNLLGMEILFGIFSDPLRRRGVEQSYDITLQDYLTSTGNYDIFSREEIHDRDEQIASLKQVLAERDGEIASLNHSIDEIYGSRSWRVTKPLRFVLAVFRKACSKN